MYTDNRDNLKNLITTCNQEMLEKLESTNLNTIMDWVTDSQVSVNFIDMAYGNAVLNSNQHYRGDIVPVQRLEIGSVIRKEYGLSFTEDYALAEDFVIRKADTYEFEEEFEEMIPVIYTVTGLYGFPITRLCLESLNIHDYVKEFETKCCEDLTITEVSTVSIEDIGEIALVTLTPTQERTIEGYDFTISDYLLASETHYGGEVMESYESECGHSAIVVKNTENYNTKHFNLGCVDFECPNCVTQRMRDYTGL